MYECVRRMKSYVTIPSAYQEPGKELWIDRSKLRGFLENVDYANQDFISKAHLFRESDRDLCLTHGNVVVLNIRRDLRDTIVSHYYHMLRDGRIRGSFSKYYWLLGRYKAWQVLQYHKLWSSPQFESRTFEFERLKTNFDEELVRLAKAIDVTLTDPDVTRIREETSLSNLSKQYGEDDRAEQDRFFRKGVIGDWQQHFDDRCLQDLVNLQTRGLGLLGRASYHVLFTARLAVQAPSSD